MLVLAGKRAPYAAVPDSSAIRACGGVPAPLPRRLVLKFLGLHSLCDLSLSRALSIAAISAFLLTFLAFHHNTLTLRLHRAKKSNDWSDEDAGGIGSRNLDNACPTCLIQVKT